MLVQSVINDHTLVATSDAGEEGLLMGGAVGLGVGPGDDVEGDVEGVWFVPLRGRSVEFVADLVDEHRLSRMGTAQEVLAAGSQFGLEVEPWVALPLAAQLSEAIMRSIEERGREFDMGMAGYVFPAEAALVEWAARHIASTEDVTLDEQELDPLILLLADSGLGLCDLDELRRTASYFSDACDMVGVQTYDPGSRAITTEFVAALKRVVAAHRGADPRPLTDSDVDAELVAGDPDAADIAEELGDFIGELVGAALSDTERLFLAAAVAKVPGP